MKRLLYFLILLNINSVRAQNKKLTLSFSPLAALDFVNFPSIQAGAEYRPSPSWGWYSELGLQYVPSAYEPRDSSFIHWRGIRIKTELRYYFQRKLNRRLHFLTGHYIAVSAFYINDAHNDFVDYRRAGDSIDSRRRDVFAVRKKVWGLNMLIGKQRSLGGRWGTDFYLGLGIRFRSFATAAQEFVYGKDLLFTPIDYNVWAQRVRAETKGGFSVVPNLTIGIRLTYRL